MRILAFFAMVSFMASAVAGDSPDPAIDNDGFVVHRVESPHQSAPTLVRVLAPSKLQDGKRYRVVYVLPVEAGSGRRYGDGLTEIKRLGLHDKYSAIVVAPTFAELPWYADHPTDARIAQEAYLLETVLPLVERSYPAVAAAEGRLLLGFSKSGWGAWTLLLRHPDHFGKAAAWDAPMTMLKPGQYGSGPIFGTQENFDRYCVSKLLASEGAKLGPAPRLSLTGYGSFRREHEEIEKLLIEQKIPHHYLDGPQRKHTWDSGWIADAVGFLLGKM